MKKQRMKKSGSLPDIELDLASTKAKKNQFLSNLSKSVAKSQSLIKQPHTSISPSKSISPSLSPSKQKSVTQLTKSIQDRLTLQRNSQIKLIELTDEQEHKRQELEKRIQEIKKRNQMRAKQLNEFEKIYIQKIGEDFRKDRLKEDRLIGEYQSVVGKLGKIRETREYRKEIEAEDWKEILKEKQKLQKMIMDYRKKQSILLKEQNPEQLKRMVSNNESKATLQQQKTEIQDEKKPKMKGDAKQIGNQYLQYAKRLKQLPKQKQKSKLLDINFKCIDYTGDMMTKIARNTGDLSKMTKMEPEVSFIKDNKSEKERKSSFKMPIFEDKERDRERKSSLKMPIYEEKEDEETKRYLKQIRNNLIELGKTG